jgi:hypothetical protein
MAIRIAKTALSARLGEQSLALGHGAVEEGLPCAPCVFAMEWRTITMGRSPLPS